MPKLTEYELEREANIARNRALLAELDIKSAVAELGLPVKKSLAKPVQDPNAIKNKRKRDEAAAAGPRRVSMRLRKSVAYDESPLKRKRRLAEEEEARLKEEEERLAAEERAREARKPRHYDLDLKTLINADAGADANANANVDSDTEQNHPTHISSLQSLLADLRETSYPKRVGNVHDFVYDEDKKEEAEVQELRERVGGMVVVARAKVTQDRIYSAAYHPERRKDLIFFGDKHGQLGIWDARAPQEEEVDEDGEVVPGDNQSQGKVWRLQPHWPATSKSSISCIKFDTRDAHNVYTSAYDCSLRLTSFETGISREVVYMEDTLISSFDLAPGGNEIWLSDADGWVTHMDLRQRQGQRRGKMTARRWELSKNKIGCVSVNPTDPVYLLAASNDRTLKIWDTRKLQSLASQAVSTLVSNLPTPPPTSPIRSPVRSPSTSPHKSNLNLNLASSTTTPIPWQFEDIDLDTVQTYTSSAKGKSAIVGDWAHGKSVSAAYWDARGRSVVSTCYDDTIRIWDVGTDLLSANTRGMKPFSRIHHNCQTGKWLTILKAQWSGNAEVYPHFTIGNMNHSLDIFGAKGQLLARLSDTQRISAVQAVTCSHPAVVERAASGNASGRAVLWAPRELSL